MRYKLPEKCLVLLVGPSGSGKSTFARTHFKPTEILSSDACRGIVRDDENDQSATSDAFDLLHYMLGKRLKNHRLTVVDATNVQPESRKKLIQIADEHYMQTIAIVFNFDVDICHARNQNRPDRQFGPHVIRNQVRELRQGIRGLVKEKLRHVYFFNDPSQVDTFEGFDRIRMWSDRTDDSSRMDVIGDVHGCLDELLELLGVLGYHVSENANPGEIVLADRPKFEKIGERGDPDTACCPLYYEVSHPEQRKAVFVGDLVDRGPSSVGVLKLVMSMVKQGVAHVVPGNHDEKLLRKLLGKNVQLTHGADLTWAEMEKESPEFHEVVLRFIDSMPGHLLLSNGELAVAHAGVKEPMIGLAHGRIRQFALYGETNGEIDEFGLPVRYPWAMDYRGKTTVVYGHTPVPEVEWLNNTIDIDTGCVFGGELTAMRWPERSFESVPAKMVYAESKRPFLENLPVLSAQHDHDNLLDLQEVIGRRHIITRNRGTILIEAENSTAALEVMSRFAANPKWLIYLPPTMSPVETSTVEGHLERPEEAFAYFRREGVSQVICEEKHMGSRAVAIVCRDAEAAQKRFGVTGEQGIIYTRTGRHFFDQSELESEFVSRIATAIGKAGLWDELETDWVALDCELMPWSAKAQALLEKQYAPVGVSAKHSLEYAIGALDGVQVEGINAIRDLLQPRLDNIHRYVKAIENYCWPVSSLDDYRLAPFHILASEGAVHFDKSHQWHMDTISRMCDHDAILFKTPSRVVNIDSIEDTVTTTEWWENLVAQGGEGMVVKPMEFIHRGPKGLTQPALKVRGPEYLRIIYGPDYQEPANIERLRKRGLKTKRGIAIKEFALGHEALMRFVEKQPLRKVHECVFGVLAMESEPVDPRL